MPKRGGKKSKGKNKQSKRPQLPNEIWQRIFRHALHPVPGERETFVYLWKAARQVSRHWRSNIAQAFLDVLIRDPNRCDIFWYIGEAWVPKMRNGEIHDFGMEMTFNRMDEGDKSRVVFAETENTRRVPKWWDEATKAAHKRKKYRMWKEGIELYLGTEGAGLNQGGCFADSKHMIYLNGPAMDTALPGLQFSTDRFEISFEWEAMLTAFLSERAEHDHRIERIHKLNFLRKGLALEARNASVREYRALLAAPCFGFKDMQKVTKDLRQARIMKHYRAVDKFWEGRDYPWDEEEERVILDRIMACQYKYLLDEMDEKPLLVDVAGTIDLAEVEDDGAVDSDFSNDEEIDFSAGEEIDFSDDEEIDFDVTWDENGEEIDRQEGGDEDPCPPM